ncbi:MAG: right-handed parallel beta-helix repeat-containing protein, partial [Planctomycetota bacterium]
MLQVDERFCPRARYPEQGTLAHLSAFEVPWMSTTGGGWKRKPTEEELTSLRYKPGDLGPWLEVQNAEVTVYHMWDESCVGVAANNAEQHVLTLKPPCGHPPGAFGVKKYVIWNVREGLTVPGQWYHDRVQDRIVYFPLPGQDMSKAEVVVPATATILSIKGKGGAHATNIALRGLAFSVATVPLLAADFAACKYDGAVSLENTMNCTLSGLTVTRVAGHGINAQGLTEGVRVENCEVSSCGAGGIYVGGSKAVITNNHVHDVGLLYPSAIGIFRGGAGNVVNHNEVHGCSYSAINYGGDFIIIEDNLIYDCMKVLHDGAAIYLFGGKDCIVRRNFARDISDTGGFGASAYYLDEQCTGCVVEKNLSLRVNWPSHNHMAKANTIRDNVFVVAGDAKITFPRSAEYVFERNVLCATGNIAILNPAAVTQWSKNLFYSGTGKIEGVKLKDYSGVGTTPGAPGDSIVADPLFVDPEKGDYRYKPDSPALKLGLEPVDVSKAGRVKN